MYYLTVPHIRSPKTEVSVGPHPFGGSLPSLPTSSRPPASWACGRRLAALGRSFRCHIFLPCSLSRPPSLTRPSVTLWGRRRPSRKTSATQVLNFLTSAKPFLPRAVTESRVLGFRTWAPLGPLFSLPQAETSLGTAGAEGVPPEVRNAAATPATAHHPRLSTKPLGATARACE